MIERGRLVDEVGDGQVEPAVAVEVAAGHAHPRQVAAARARRQARNEPFLGETEASLITEEIIGRHVVGDEQVDLAVVVEVGRDDPQAPPFMIDETRSAAVTSTNRPPSLRKTWSGTAGKAGGSQ